MKRSILFSIFIVLSLLLSGCLSVFVPVDTPTPGPTALTFPTPAPTQDALQTALPQTTAVTSAAMCQVDPLVTSCSSPKTEIRDKFCVKKYPYVLVASQPGVTFEPASEGLKCTDEGLRGGEQIISCTGPELLSYNLKVCNATCSASLLDTASGKCPSGYGFSAEAGCCWPVPAQDSGCVLIKVDMGTCN